MAISRVFCPVRGISRVGDQFQQCEQIRQRRDNFCRRHRSDGPVGFQCFQECRFVGDEQNDEIRRSEQPLIFLASQFRDVLTYRKLCAAKWRWRSASSVAEEQATNAVRETFESITISFCPADAARRPSQVAAFFVFHVVLRFVVDTFGQSRTIENGFEQHLAPISLHFQIAFECIGQIGCLGRDAPVEFHQIFQFGFQFASLRCLRRVNLLDPLAKISDVVAERFQ